MARDLDALAVIFPFEPDCYKDTSLPVEFVGHPFLAPEYVPPVRYDPVGPVLLLPGSRVQAVARIFPVLLAGFAEFLKATPTARALVLFPSEEVAAITRSVLETWPQLAGRVELKQVAEGGVTNPFAARAVLTSSGTMSLHCALAEIPGAIAYRTNALTYLLARLWVKIEYIGIANLLLKEPMYPEFIQAAAKPEALADQLRDCTTDPVRGERTRAQAARLRGLLGRPAGNTAAEWLVRRMGG
jgi:lipid-A-disaccharide synthase